MKDVIVIGIAGGTCSGKSTLIQKIKDEFGQGYFDWRGEFKRKEFGNHIFRFPKLRIKYEQIIMPYIIKEIEEAFKRYEENGEKLVVLDAPTLIENNIHKKMDYVVLVTAKNSIVISRVRARDKLSNNDIISRINAQMPMEEKKEFADIIIDNNSDLENVKNQVQDMIKFFKAI